MNWIIVINWSKLFNLIKGFLVKNDKISETWNSFNILSTEAATVGNYDLGIIKEENDLLLLMHKENIDLKESLNV